MMTLEELYKHAFWAAEHIFKRHGVLRPMWLCVMPDGGIQPVVIKAPSKDAVVAAMREFFSEEGVVRYAYMDEAWTLETDDISIDAKQAELAKYGGRVRNHPDRIEVVHVVCEECGRNMMGYRKIIRPTEGPPTLGPEIPPMTNNVGRFYGLLEPTTH
jgi:hypothetical protein